jgi:hypothetical protein
VIPRESYFAIPGRAGMKIPFSGTSRDPGNLFLLKRTKIRQLSFKKMHHWLTLFGAPRLLTRDFMHIIVDF